jgi:hypothetical protein
MKKIKNFAGMMAIVFGVFTMNACNPCRNVDCGVNGECEEGVCICDAGYEGDACETRINAKFEGTYSTTDACAGAGYSQTVSASTATPTEIVFSNLGNFTNPAVVRATVSNSTSFAASNFVDATGRSFSVTGSISGTTISLNYTVTYSDGEVETCNNVVMTR